MLRHYRRRVDLRHLLCVRVVMRIQLCPVQGEEMMWWTRGEGGSGLKKTDERCHEMKTESVSLVVDGNVITKCRGLHGEIPGSENFMLDGWTGSSFSCSKQMYT